jgi:hypothetical protein
MSTAAAPHESDTAHQPLATALTVLAGVLTVAIRLVPHPANFAAVGAMGIYGGTKLRGWRAYVLPIAIMVISDVGLWAYASFDRQYLFHISRVYVYASFLLYVGIGRLLRNWESPLAVVGASLLGSLQFFVVTNFFVWLLQPFEPEEYLLGAMTYSRDLAGLFTCFVNALPFYQGESFNHLNAIFVGDPRFGAIGLVAGDLIFTSGLFALHAVLVRRSVPVTETAITAASR